MVFENFERKLVVNFEGTVLEDYLELDKTLETGNQLRSKFLFLGMLCCVSKSRQERLFSRLFSI